MILPSTHADKYLQDYKDGKIAMGLGIGCPVLDNHIRFKRSQFVMLNGFDNVGKTAFMLWYFLCLSVKHNLTWCVWSGENNPAQLTRQLIEFYTGKKLKEIEAKDIYTHSQTIGQWFKFIDIKKTHNYKDLLAWFKEAECDGCLIDPYTGLNKDRKIHQHDYNYEFCNAVREFANSSGISCYVNTHPQTEATRRIFPADHDLSGYPQAPNKADVEGGQPFANRADDFLTGHRLTQHPDMRTIFLLYVRKIRDHETGGNTTDLMAPIQCHYNQGLGYIINEFNPLKQQNQAPTEYKQKELPINDKFFDELDAKEEKEDLPF